MDRDFIVSEVKRTAASNGGAALGRLRLESECGIKEHHWRKFWARYSELVREAGLAPNLVPEAWSEEKLCAFIALLARDLGRFPTTGDLLVRKTGKTDFPSNRIFDFRLGGKSDKVAKVAAWCSRNAGFEDVAAMCSAAVAKELPAVSAKMAESKDGHVYLLKSGKFYKIGFSIHAGSRERQLAIQLPEAASTVHVIATDDPPGIESYWHRRFAAKRKNGEWFDLSREDVAVFKRRKFM